MDCKELVRIEDGYQELEINLSELLNFLQARRLTVFPRLATGDGAWFFEIQGQRYFWTRSTNVLECIKQLMR